MCNKTKKTNESKIFLTETDCSDSGNRLTTSYSYDGWGRNISVNYPDGANKSISLSLDIQSGVMNGYIMTTAQSGSPAVIGTYTYADASHPHAVTSVSNPYGVMDASLRQTVSYTAFGKAAEITEELLTDDDGNALSSPQTVSSRRIIYGPDHQRWQTVLTDHDGTVTTISYLPGCDFVKRGSTTTYNCYVSADGELVAVATLTGLIRNVFYTETDHLGSITGLVNTSGTEVFRAEYDAWGKRNVTLSGSSIVAPGYLASGASTANYMPLRGYTGHEHYMECGLIDMNGRMYDPLTARFLSPDPYVQMPDNPQNFNRYAYCLNNPLMYTDPSGELFGMVWYTAFTDLIVKAFFEGGLDFTSKEARREAWRNFDPTASGTKTNNAIKIEMGLFETDPNKSVAGRALQLILRFTWELPQTILGNLDSHFRNNLWSTNVTYFNGATIVDRQQDYYYDKDRKGSHAVTMGSYINSYNMMDGTEDGMMTLRHEYGHVLQSRYYGPGYIPQVGFQSILGATWGCVNPGYKSGAGWTEVEANILSYKYFSEYDYSFNDQCEKAMKRLSSKKGYQVYPINFRKGLHNVVWRPITSYLLDLIVY